jgi:hypothetical protein
VTSAGWCRSRVRYPPSARRIYFATPRTSCQVGRGTRPSTSGTRLSGALDPSVGSGHQSVGPAGMVHWTRLWNPPISRWDPPARSIGPTLCGRLVGGTRIGWWDQMKFANLNGHIDELMRCQSSHSILLKKMMIETL